jgi:hypothetical protein
MRAVIPLTRLVIPIAALAVGLDASPSPGQSALDPLSESLPVDAPQPIYSADSADTWNRIFHALFTRPVRARLTEEFAGAGPFERTPDVMGFPTLAVSMRTFGRIEGGDRAIEPLYQSPADTGPSAASSVLAEPRFTRLKLALADALNEDQRRPPLGRALMQADLWAAHDVLTAYPPPDDAVRERTEQHLAPLARLVKRLALTRREIEELPDNYAIARLSFDPFAADGGWVEVEYLPERIHDVAADLRRATRVFVKPASPPRDRHAWLDGLRADFGRSATRELDAVALVVQLLLIDGDGVVVPTRLTYEVQVRSFPKGEDVAAKEAGLFVAELSRKALLLDPRSGGLRPIGERSPSYLPGAGNDYAFAPRHSGRGTRPEPILAPLRKRCQSCHGPDTDILLTFLFHHVDPPRPVRLLGTAANKHAHAVAAGKKRREDFRELKRHWDR